MTSHMDILPTSEQATTIVTINTTNSTQPPAPSFRRTENLTIYDASVTVDSRESIAATRPVGITLSPVIWSKEENESMSNLSKSLETTEPIRSMAAGGGTENTGEREVATITPTPGRHYEQDTRNTVSDDTSARPTEHVLHHTTVSLPTSSTDNETAMRQREDKTDKTQPPVLGTAQSMLSLVTNTVTNTATNTVTNRATNTVTNTARNTVTNKATNTVTNTARNTVTNTATNTVTNTARNTVTNTARNTVTNTATNTVTNTVMNTSTKTMMNTVTNTAMNTATNTVINTLMNTVTLREDTVQVKNKFGQVRQSSELDSDVTPIVTDTTSPDTHLQTVAGRQQTADGSPTLRDTSQLTTLSPYSTGEKEQSVTDTEWLVGDDTNRSGETVFPTRATTKSNMVFTGVDRTVTNAQEPDTMDESPATSGHIYTIGDITEAPPYIADVLLNNNRTVEHVTYATEHGDTAVTVLRYQHERVTHDVTLLAAVLGTTALLSCVIGVIMWVVVSRREYAQQQPKASATEAV